MERMRCASESLGLMLRNPKVMLPQLAFFALMAILFSGAPVVSYYLVLLPSYHAGGALAIGTVRTIQFIFRTMLVLQVAAAVLVSPVLTSTVMHFSAGGGADGASLRRSFAAARGRYGKLVMTNLLAMVAGAAALLALGYAAWNFTGAGAVISGLDPVGFTAVTLVLVAAFLVCYYCLFFQSMAITSFGEDFGPEAVIKSVSVFRGDAAGVMAVQLPIIIPAAAAYAAVEAVSFALTSQPAVGFSMTMGIGIPLASILSQVGINLLQVLVLAAAETWLLISAGSFYAGRARA